MAHDERGPASPRFEPGAKVRVRYGVADPDFPDIPLGGWAGAIETVEIVDDQITYEVKWDRKTLDGMHPVYRKRRERDGLDLEPMWLGQENHEADDGIPVPIEQPTRILTPPLSEKDQDDRVRGALGWTHEDPLPEVTDETLLAYPGHLAANLTLPIHVASWENSGPFASKKVTVAINGLGNAQAGRIDDDFGLIGLGRNPKGEEIEFPLGEIELGKKDPNRGRLSENAYWFDKRR
jgi:hypothetical protein